MKIIDYSKKDFINWWYDVKTVFRFNAEVKLFNIDIALKTLLFDIHINTNIPPVLKHYSKIPFSYSFNIKKYKSGWIEIYFESNLITGISVEKTVHRDHAGFEITISLFGFQFNLTIYDTRHWDDEKDKFEGDEGGEE